MVDMAKNDMITPRRRYSVKLAFHDDDTDTDTDILADFRARIVHEPDTHEDPRRLVPTRGAIFLARLSVRDARVYTYTVHNKRIPNVGVCVRVCVGPVEFQLKRAVVISRVTLS